MRELITALVVIATITNIGAKVYFEEHFDDAEWINRWVQSEHPAKELAKFTQTPGKYYANETDLGIRTTADSRHYAISTKFESFSNKDKPLVIQYTAKNEQNLNCGGSYIKLFDSKLNPTNMHGETPYKIMFGPDKCGPSKQKVHVIFNYKEKNHLITKEIKTLEEDFMTHIYTLIIDPTNTYKVLIDNNKVESGALEEDFEFLPPKEVNDESVTKPHDWDDRKQIVDVTDTKPEDWDQPEEIPDTNAKKPEDWDDEMDGEWEPPMVDNPKYRGPWKPKSVDNPNYQGKWVQPKMPNPEYYEDKTIYAYEDISGIGFDLWQVEGGTIFDKILITDDPDVASAMAKKILEDKLIEKKAKESYDQKERKLQEDSKDKDDEDKDDEDDDDSDSDIDQIPKDHDEL